jgi:hypothetical protein
MEKERLDVYSALHMKHRILLGIGIGLTVIADVAVLMVLYGWLSRARWIVLGSAAAALVMFIWAARQSSGWGAMSLLYFFAQALFLPFADFAGFSSNDLFFPALIVPWIFFGLIQFVVVCVRIRLELGAEKRDDPGEPEAQTR